MRGGRILWGQIIVVFTIVLVMVWTSTQWVAFRLGFQPQLGNPWFDVAGWPVYYPPAFFWWWFSYDAYAPGIFTEGAFIATSGALFAIAAAFSCRSSGRARRATSPPTVLRDGPRTRKSMLPDCSVPMTWSLAGTARTISGTTAPSMSFVSRPPDQAKASVSLCRRC